MQHLIVYSSVITSPLDSEWARNGANHFISHKFGFGKLDAYNLVSLAQIWVNVPKQKYYSSSIITLNQYKLYYNKFLNLNRTFNTTFSNQQFINSTIITKLEHVVLVVSFSALYRGYMTITIISPMNTISKMLSKRKFDKKHGVFVKNI